MASIFSRIVAGEIPCYKVAEDENYFAFLDISPVAKGHTLVIPKQEVDYIFDLDDETYVGLTRFAKRVAKAIEKAIPCKRVGVAVMGLEVPHTHIHLVPINKEADMNFFRDKLSLESTEMQAIAEAYYGVNDKILTSTLNDTEFISFYENVIEPISVQLSYEFTFKLLTPREIGYGNRIDFVTNLLQSGCRGYTLCI